MKERPTVAVVGNPNCGKTTLFNALTGSRQRVGNWPGVTVERKSGAYRFDGREVVVDDLPGIYSLDPAGADGALDEQIACDYLHSGGADLIVDIVDASNLERNLYLTSQLLEMGLPMVVALNMTDVAEGRGASIDAEALARELGCPVVPLVASRGRGVEALRRAIRETIETRRVPRARPTYAPSLERALERLGRALAASPRCAAVEPRWLAARLLEGDEPASRIAGPAADPRELDRLRGEIEGDVDLLLADGRYGLAHRVALATVRRAAGPSRTRSDRVDRVVLNRFLGIPLFLAVMYLMFLFTIQVGGALVDFFDLFAGALVVDGPAAALAALGAPEWLIVLLAEGVGGGIRVVATFIPILFSLYLVLAVLEDSGYMARAAYVMDRFMRSVGLPGKSFLPLIVGFGCNVPAIMASRTLERRRDRILTVLMTPFMSCGARLPVYALFAAAFFPSAGQNVVLALYAIGIALALLTGFLMTRTLLRGEPAAFVMELPPYHVPTLGGVLRGTWHRTSDFVLGAGRVIVPIVLVLNLLGSIGTDGSFGRKDTEASLLGATGRALAPAFSPMGLAEDNWPAAVGIVTGLLAKEAVVGTLDSTYSALAAGGAGATTADEPFDLVAAVGAAWATVPRNLADALGAWADPLGLRVGETHDVEAAAAAQEVGLGTFGAMRARFDGAAGAFAYLLFILLYSPCAAAIAAVQRETGAAWTLFVAAWTTGLAYAVATIAYQGATFARHPTSSLAWIAGLLTSMALVFLVLRRVSRDREGRLRRQAGGIAAVPEGVEG